MSDTKHNIQITSNSLNRDFHVNIQIGKYSPGDGWTRYSVSVNGWNDIKQGMTSRECEIYLQGLYDMMRVQWDEKKRGCSSLID